MGVTYIVVDVEADGPIPGKYSMVALGAVVLDDPRDSANQFYATLRPMTEHWQAEALAIAGFTREQTLGFREPADAIRDFAGWLASRSRGKRLQFISDNAGFDWQFVNFYCHVFLGHNPFGHSPASLTWLYKGFRKDARASIRPLRKTEHSHNALEDAIGNAEALLAIRNLGMRL
ncbi:MAG TPA: exonuclease domain-containing protein [Thermomicrobiales bacterium]